MRATLMFLLAIILFSSCEKEDKAIVLPPPGDLTKAVANMGSAYDNQVYFDFETGTQKVVPYRSYDIAFEASADGFRVYLNTGKFMFVANTFSTDITTADSTGKEWKTDADNLYDDSTAIGSWINGSNQSLNNVYVIDRGRTEHFGSSRWRKFQLLSVNDIEYKIRFSLYNNTQVTDFTIPKNPSYSLVYFSFENGGQLADVAPPKNLWDVVFTKYTHTYYSEPINSPYRYYIVSGALLNKWSGAVNEIVKQDSSMLFIPFTDIKAADMGNYNFNNYAGTIGFEWKYYDFNLGYIVYDDRYYLLKDQSGYFYKIHFLDFYDSQGNKGAATFEYQRL
jgi:hypothetical protein